MTLESISWDRAVKMCESASPPHIPGVHDFAYDSDMFRRMPDSIEKAKRQREIDRLRAES